MLVLYIITLMFTNSINHLQKYIHSIFINRITIITLLFSIFLTFNTLYFQSIGKGISIYSGLFQSTVQSHIIEIFLLLVGISILLGWPILTAKSVGRPAQYIESSLSTTEADGEAAKLFNTKSDQYSLIALFSILGGSLLMSSLDLLSMYLSIELQSFALYILAALNKDQLSATSAGLKYFLLGSLSSCLILLGSALIYSYTGLTQFEAINTLFSISSLGPLVFNEAEGGLSNSTIVQAPIWIDLGREVLAQSLTPLSPVRDLVAQGQDLINPVPLGCAGARGLELAWPDVNKAFTIGLIIIIIGFLFKISAAPFYQWAPDVYDGTPTIVTVWLTIVVKLTILIFLLGLIEFALPNVMENLPTLAQANIHLLPEPLRGCESWGWQIKNLLLISSLLSLLIGTVAGLSQIKIKRLLAFSSISHVGFLLLALGIFTQNSIDSFIFYLIQYSITSLNIFLILLALGYIVAQHYRPLSSLSVGSLTAPSLFSFIPLRQACGLKTKRQGLRKLGVHRQTHASHTAAKAGEGAEQHLNSKAWGPDSPETLDPFLAQAQADINYLIELKGQLNKNPVLSISLAICLFSMAGIPPLIGFFSKQFVLFSSIENGNNFLSIIAILVSVISASYYLKLIKVILFPSASAPASTPAPILPSSASEPPIGELALEKEKGNLTLNYLTAGVNMWPGLNLNFKFTNFHSYSIAILTFLILFFFLDPSILLNGTQLISLTIFNL